MSASIACHVHATRDWIATHERPIHLEWRAYFGDRGLRYGHLEPDDPQFEALARAMRGALEAWFQGWTSHDRKTVEVEVQAPIDPQW